MAEPSSKFVDVEKVFREKNPTVANILPGFVLNYVKRVVHEDDINRFIQHNGHLRDHAFVQACLDEVGAKTRATGLEHIPQTGGCIVVANHPLGGLDGLGLMQVVGQRRPDIRFFVNDILLNLQAFGELFVGVNKHGKNPKENLRLMDEIFASDQCVLFFPAGLVSRRQGGVIKDLEWQKSFVAKAIQYQKPIVPAFIGGRNSNFFYTFANWRKRLGIKSNIEMFFLVDEIYKQRNQTVDFHFGPAIPAARFTKEKNHAAWAQALRDHIYTLPQGNPTHF
jgi:putative hemolysin